MKQSQTAKIYKALKAGRKQSVWLSMDWSASPFNILRNIPAGLDGKRRIDIEAECKYCGSIKVYRKGNMIMARSCGCQTASNQSRDRTIHGHSHSGDRPASPTYNSWAAMLDRCLKPRHKSYKDYGGRGISVCDRWVRSFEAFLEDMGIRPESATIGRKNNEGNYCKENCQWETMNQQMRNRRDNRMLQMGGITKTMVDWAEETGIAQDTIGHRLGAGWSVEKALTHPPRKQKGSRYWRSLA